MAELWLAALGGFGSAALIVAVLSNWLGKVWAARILERDRVKYQAQLERIKLQYDAHFDALKSIIIRYSDNQFGIYRDLWGSLCELKLTADQLWDKATPEKVGQLSESLVKANFWLEKSSLFIEDEHYTRLKLVFSDFSNFLSGKESLLAIRDDLNLSDDEKIQITTRIVSSNEGHRESLSAALGELRNHFKQQISGYVIDD